MAAIRKIYEFTTNLNNDLHVIPLPVVVLNRIEFYYN